MKFKFQDNKRGINIFNIDQYPIKIISERIIDYTYMISNVYILDDNYLFKIASSTDRFIINYTKCLQIFSWNISNYIIVYKLNNRVLKL